jgi:hypothetical protein
MGYRVPVRLMEAVKRHIYRVPRRVDSMGRLRQSSLSDVVTHALELCLAELDRQVGR